MAETAKANSHWTLRIRRPSLVESLVLVTIIAILVALLLPGPQWAADGSIEVPVRVRVFDVATAQPIAAADVVPFRGPWRDEPFSIDEYRDWFPHENPRLAELGKHYKSDKNGTVVVPSECPTTASHKHPDPVAHVPGWWLMVSAEGYGATVLPVRYESVPTRVIDERGELLVTVGLMAAR
jgi:hypothetical protein